MSHHVDDSLPCDVSSERILKARKEHRCDACHVRILPGHYDVRHFIVCDGNAHTIRRCGRCELLYRHLVEHLDEFGEFPDQALDCGHTWEEMNDGQPPPPELAELAFATEDEIGAMLRPTRGES